MRSVVLYIATSLEGYIARPDGSVDWLFTDQDYGYGEFYAGVDTVVIGRKTYDQLIAIGEFPYRGKECVVFSRSRGGSRDEHAMFVAEDVPGYMNRLKLKPGKNIWLVGGAELVQAFLQYGLVDILIVSIHPVILGSGIPLFKTPLPSSRLQLVDCTTFNSGLVQMTYVRQGVMP